MANVWGLWGRSAPYGGIMKEILGIIDEAIKRLVTPVAMLVAAALISQGLKTKDSSHSAIYFLMIVLVVWAAVYALMSILVAINELQKTGIGNIRMAVISSSFILVYFVLFCASLRIGLDKVPLP
jgi:threonine/homoserine/homoserine lactone efflux protein